MYYTTKLYITHTLVDFNALNARIYHSICTQRPLSEILTQHTQEESNALLQQAIRTQNALIPHFETKDELQTILQSIYHARTSVCIIFLGNIQSYSLVLQESLLKLLEEPPEHIQIVLYAPQKEHVLPTILSRSQTTLLDVATIFSFIDSEIMLQVSKKLPNPQEFVKTCLQFRMTENVPLVDVKSCEREEISLWLWHLLAIAKQLYIHNNGSRIIARLIEKLLMAQNLNEKNSQKKFVIEYLFTS